MLHRKSQKCCTGNPRNVAQEIPEMLHRKSQKGCTGNLWSTTFGAAIPAEARRGGVWRKHIVKGRFSTISNPSNKIALFFNYKIFKVRKYLWNLTEYPETSLAARVREMYNKIVSEDFPRISFPKTCFPDLCVHLDDCGDYLDAHLRPLHDAGVGRGYRRRPLRQRDRCVGGFS